MQISMFGLGYVGCVGAACLAKLGHHVIGNDISENKVNLLNQGKPTIIEAEIDELCREVHEKGLLEATMDCHYAVHNSEISFIAVGTPSSKEGHLNLDYIYMWRTRSAKQWLIKMNSILSPSEVPFYQGQIKKWEKLLKKYLEKSAGKTLLSCQTLNFYVREQRFMII